jgi:hypothetical protein
VEVPQRLIGDRAYDSDPLDERLKAEGIELIAPHRTGRVKPATQDGRPLRRFRRIQVRYEHIAENSVGLLHLACIILLLKVFLR